MSISPIGKGVMYLMGSLLANAFVPLFSQWSMKSFTPLEVAFLISMLNVLYCLIWSIKWPVFQGHVMIVTYLKSASINAIGIVCLYASLAYLDPITFAFLSVFYVVFTSILATLVLKEGKTPMEIVTICVGICGAFLLAHKGGARWTSLVGVGLVILDTLCFALANYQVKSASPSLNPVAVLFFNNITCTLMLVPFVFQGMTRHFSLGFQASHILGILVASACSFAAVGLVFASYKLMSFRLSSLVRAVKPLVSTAVALPVASAELSCGNWFGAFLLFISILVLVSKERKA